MRARRGLESGGKVCIGGNGITMAASVARIELEDTTYPRLPLCSKYLTVHEETSSCHSGFYVSALAELSASMICCVISRRRFLHEQRLLLLVCIRLAGNTRLLDCFQNVHPVAG